MEMMVSANRLIPFSPICDSNYLHVAQHKFPNVSFFEIQESLIKTILRSKSINSIVKDFPDKSLVEKKFSHLINKAKNTYFEIYKKEFKNIDLYTHFFHEMKYLVSKEGADFHLYDNSVRFDFAEGNNIFIIEYSSEDNFLTVTKKSDEDFVMKECELGSIELVLKSFGE